MDNKIQNNTQVDIDKKEKILIYKGESKYNVLRIFADYLVEAFEKLDYEVYLFDFMDLENFNKIQFDCTFKFILGINGMGINANLDGKSIYKILNVPFVSLFVDHPIYHAERLAKSRDINQCICTFIDKEHINFVNDYFFDNSKVCFLPHAGCVPINIIPYEQRKYNVVFFGSYDSPNEVYQELNNKTGIVGIELSKFWIEHIDLTFEEAFRQFLDTCGESMSNGEFLFTMLDLIIVDKYIRSYYRDAVIRAILNENQEIHVFGAGWEKFDYVNDLLVKHEQVDFLETLEIMANSKIVCNITAVYRNGGHERIFSSMLAKSVCISERNRYLETEFKENEEIILYDLNKLEEVPVKIKYLIENEEVSKSIAKRANEITKEKHQWKNRAEYIIKLINEL